MPDLASNDLLYARDDYGASQERLLALDLATGAPVAELAGGNQPWGFLWVEMWR